MPTVICKFLSLLVLIGLVVFQSGCSKSQLRSKYDVSESTLSEHSSVEKLIQALDDPSESLRAWAAVYLRVIGPNAQQAIPKLKEVAENDPDTGVRDRSLRALGEIYRRL